jgi:glyoxylase-like metal-dependent hydrolase (beta-lactamase superfamily II)
VTDPASGWRAHPCGVLTAHSTHLEMNSVALPGARDTCVLVDPGVTWAEIVGLLAGLRHLGLELVAVVHTHAHWDHLLWPTGLAPEIPRWASRACIETASRNARALRAQAAVDVGRLDAEGLLSELDRLVALPTNGAVPQVPQLSVVEHHAHSRGHIAVLHEPSGTLCAGDMLSDVELPLPDGSEAGDEGSWELGGYLDGLDALQPFVRRASLVVPGHGNPGDDAPTRLANDRAYLDDILHRRGSDDGRLADRSNRSIHTELQNWVAAADAMSGGEASLADEAAMARLRQAEADVAAGDVTTAEELAGLMEQRRQRERSGA